jgi:tetratricopeptide (TPR) repeat protein
MILKKKNIAIFFLVLSVQAFVINPVYGALQDGAKRELLKEAESQYYNGDFDNAIKSTNQFLSQENLSNDYKKDAYVLLAHIYLAKSDAASARKVIESIFNIDPAYGPTLEEETPKYVTFVSEIKKQYLAKQVKPKEKEIDWVLWGSAGAGAALLIILLATGGDDKGSGVKPLSNPPPFPENK